MDEITINNAIALLKELQINVNNGPEILMAWALGEKDIIQETIKDLEDIEKGE